MALAEREQGELHQVMASGQSQANSLRQAIDFLRGEICATRCAVR
jgi:hypothetical protein